MIDPGQMKTRLVYEELADVGVDAHGRAVREWSPRFELWALVRPASGREAYQAEQVKATVRHVVTCRWRPGLKPSGRLRWKNKTRTLEIESVANVDEAGVEATIDAIETVGG